MKKGKGLCRIGELAVKAGVPKSTVHYYCQMGLLDPDGYSPGGYRLFDGTCAVEKIREIQDVVQSKITLKDLVREMAAE